MTTMTPTTTDRDPGPTLAAACRNCGTTGGHISGRAVMPMRVLGYCSACYQRARRYGFPAVVPPPKNAGRGSYREPIAHTCAHCGAGFMAYASKHQRYCSWACTAAALYPSQPHPIPRDLIVTPAMLGITPAMLGIAPGEIGKHYFTAQAQLWADEAACILAGAQWRQRHPEQFAPDHLARLFGGDATHAFWHEDAVAAA